MQEFPRIKRLPPYVFTLVNQYKQAVLDQGKEVIDLGMGNPDQPPSAKVIEKLIERVKEPGAHRYSISPGMLPLREAICEWYKTRYDVTLDPKTETIVTLGSKEGLSHLAYAMITEGDTVIVPQPSYPIHYHSFVIAGANVVPMPLSDPNEFILTLKDSLESGEVKPNVLILNFPANPSSLCVTLEFFEEVVALAKKYDFLILHDFAYADIVYDDNPAPSILQVPGAKDVAVESYSLSKGHNMPGWRIGFISGNPALIEALRRIKAYLDYGTFIPIQEAAIVALLDDEEHTQETRELYKKRRDTLCTSLADIGWKIPVPEATLFAWAKIPEQYQDLGSLKFTQLLLEKANVAVSPGVGFGALADQYVRFSLVENEEKLKEAVHQIDLMFQHDSHTKK